MTKKSSPGIFPEPETHAALPSSVAADIQDIQPTLNKSLMNTLPSLP